MRIQNLLKYPNVEIRKFYESKIDETYKFSTENILDAAEIIEKILKVNLTDGVWAIGHIEEQVVE